MSKLLRKIKEKEIRKNDIIIAAEKLFLTNSYNKTTMDDIAKEAEYTKKTIYSYFRSKDELYLLILLKNNKTRWAYQEKEIDKKVTGYKKLYIFGDTYYKFFSKNKDILKFQIYWDYNKINIDKIDPEIFQQYHRWNLKGIEKIRQAFNIGIKDKSLKENLHVDMTINHLLYSLRIILNKAIFPTYSFANFESEKYYYHFLNFFLKAIKK